ncbi:MAG: glycosyltransferase, partial [Desulfobacteraceae bacterium]|nr:glycosyltransferase [Desulfobacteraceae bacterium]
RLYHKTIRKYFQFTIPENSSVAEIGCGTGDLLQQVRPGRGLGIDFSEEMIRIAKEKYPNLEFMQADAEDMEISEKFDYIIVSDLLSSLIDIQSALKNIKLMCHDGTRLIFSNFNYFWEPVLKLGELIRLRQKQPYQNWLSFKDIENLLDLEGYESIKLERKLLLPKYVPILGYIFNRIFANLPVINGLNLINFMTAKPIISEPSEYSVSIVVPARNEKGNIENAILRTPKFGTHQQFIFVEGNSKDNTYEEMLRVQEKYEDLDILVTRQSGKGKGNAVREGFDRATGDVLMILDADLTTPPEDMPKFYNAIADGKGELINGCRLVYPLEKQAMRFLNYLGNKFFGWFFSYLLGQRLKDTLCGTKVLFRHDYDKIQANRDYFVEFDPFGDFDILFGAAKLNLKITEIIVRYREREYGSTQISRFKHGWLLIKMSLFAARKLKFK